MNYCTKCESLYRKPGTCNCYAEAQPAKLVPQPYTPPPTWVPTPYPDGANTIPYLGQPWPYTITWTVT